LLGVVKEELLALKGQYASERKTIIFANAQQEFSEEDMIPNVGCMVTVTHDGFIKRTEINLYRQQKRGGKGVIATGQHEEDFVEHLFTASTHDCVMFVMNNGRVYVEKVYEIPDGSRTAKGRSIANVLQLQAEEKVSAMLCFKTFEQGISLVICTKNGVIKKTAMREYVNCRAGGLNGTVLDEGDEIISAALTYGNNDVMLFSYKGMAIRFHESDLRDQGRVTRGVKGMALRTNDCVKGMVVVDPEKTLLIAGIKGHGKRTHFDEFKAQKRGGIGVTAIRTPGVTGALSIQDVDEIMLLTQSGQSIRVPVNQIRIIGRSTSGVRLIRLDANDKLIGMCKVVETEAEAV
jgi:DNA gyrase subunit A